MSRHLLAPLVVGVVALAAFACSSSTAPANLTGPYVGTYTMDSVTAGNLKDNVPAQRDARLCDGVRGTLKLTSDSFFIALSGTFPGTDSGTFSISSSNQWTLDGTLFSGTGTGAMVGNQLQISLTGGAALGSLYGLFTKQ